MRDMLLAFVDIETTGLDLQKDEVCQVSYILTTPRRINSESIIEVYDCEFQTSSEPEEHVLPYTSWTKERNAEAERPSLRSLTALNKDLNGRILVGHNVKFDEAFLSKLMKDHGIEPSWRYHAFDTVSLASILYMKGEIESLSLSSLASHYGIKNENPHDSFHDIVTTYKVFIMLCIELGLPLYNCFRPEVYTEGEFGEAQVV